ncbi:MAG TPA: biotin transporter BioY [Streptococcus parasuis]|nr:biotin transporter BioY [Streptococcus parasuis]
MTKTSTRSLVYIAIGTALIAALSQISLSIGPVPFTLQTLAIGLVACLYKPKDALASVGLYLVLGAIGLPVFAGFSGGFAALVGPTAGFLWGFLLYAYQGKFILCKCISSLFTWICSMLFSWSTYF